MKKLALCALSLLALLCACATPALAQNCSAYPFTFAPNTVIRSAQLNSNFASILSCANSSLAHNGINSDITAITGLITPLTQAQGGTGFGQTYINGQLLIGDSTVGGLDRATLTAGSGINIANGPGTITISSAAGGGTVTSVGLQDATNGGITISGSASPITGSGAWNAAVNVNDLVTKTTPVSTDLIALYDVSGATSAKGTAAKVIAAVPCSTTLPGSVPATGGGTANFLRADCTFAAPPGALVAKHQEFTASGTFTTPAGTTSTTVYKFIVTGSGAGGGNTATGPSGAGGAGDTEIFYGTGVSSGATVTVTINNAGAAGGNGGSASIVFNGTTVTAPGGTAGTAGGNNCSVAAGGAAGGAGGVAGTNGTYHLPGQAGTGAFCDGNGNGLNGTGGASFWGGGFGAGGNGDAAGTKGFVAIEWMQ